jgi:hypothetical protein
MACVVTIKVLVDEPDPARLMDGLEEMMQAASTPIEEDGAPWLIDWNIDLETPVNDAIDDSIVNDTYVKGDAFKNWVIYSISEAKAQDGNGYWSNTYGWTSFDLATRFEATNCRLPNGAGMDACWMLAEGVNNVQNP